ncbi:putative cellulose expressed protein 1, partial [Perkinsus chesapeaki]
VSASWVVVEYHDFSIRLLEAQPPQILFTPFMASTTAYLRPVITWLCINISLQDHISFVEYSIMYGYFFEEGSEDYARKERNYYKNLELIDEHNAQESSFKMGITPFTHLTPEEFDLAVGKNKLIGGSPINDTSPYYLGQFNYTGAHFPDSIDWREKGVVTKVKNQGACGSCWAFSAVGALEGAYQRHGGELTSLSVEELVDCTFFRPSHFNEGCLGGLPEHAFDYVAPNGLSSEEAYPYHPKLLPTCKANLSNDVIKPHDIKGYMNIHANDTKALKEALTFGPVSVAIEADTTMFQNYKSGILPA